MARDGTPLPAERFEKFARPVTNGWRWARVDPQKDQEANAPVLAQRTISRIEVIGQQDGDVDTTFRNIARVQKLAKKHGFSLPEDVEASSALMLAKSAAEPPSGTSR